MEGVVHLLQILCNPPSQEQLKMAEEHLSNAKEQPGFSVLVLQIVLAEGIPDPVRTLSAIVLKQVVDERWNTAGGSLVQIPDSDKSVIRENVVQALLHCHPQVAAQLRETIKKIIQADWPKRWPDLIPRVLDILKNQQEPRMLEGALFCLCAVVKKSEWRPAKREKMYALVQSTFPFLFEFLCHVRTINTPESYAIQKLICKTFYASFQLKMPPFLKGDEVLGPWLGKFMEILMSPLPAGEPQEPNQRSEWAPWKAKKWCLHIFNRLFVRFGDPMLSKKKEKRQWAKNFVKNYATKILEGVLQILELKKTGMWMPDSFLCVLMRYVSTSIRHTATWPILGPRCPSLLVDVLMPITCFSEEDHRIWNEDPEEYIRKEYDILEEYYSVKTTALDIICTLSQSRKDETFGFILEMVVNVFKTYESVPDSLKNPSRLEGALHVFASISEEYMSNHQFSDSLDPLIAQYVLPHLENPHGFVVARACNAFGRYATYIDNESLVVEGTKRVLNALKHNELPARVQGAMSLRYLVQTDHAKSLLQGVLPDIFQIMFALMNEVDNDDLVSSLDAIIFEFRHSIGPYAVAICDQLTKELFRLNANINPSDDDCDAAILAASECGRTLVTVLGSVRKTPELYPQILDVVYPFLKHATNTDENEDYFENAMKILAFISYYIPKPFPPHLWGLIEDVVTPVEGYPSEFIDEIVPFLDNMITRDPDTLVTGQQNGKTFLELVWNLLSHILDQKGCEVEGSECLKLIEVLLQNCRGKIDFLVPRILEIILKRLSNAEDPKFKILLFAVFGNLLFYNPLLGLQSCEQRGVTDELLRSFLAAVESDQIQRLYDRKQVSLGLSSILQIPLSQLPQNVQGLVPGMVGMNITLLNRMNDQIMEKLKKEEEKKQAVEGGAAESPYAEASEHLANQYLSSIRNDDDDDDDDDDGVIDDDDDDDAAIQSLVQQIQACEGETFGLEDSDDEDYDVGSDDEEDIDADSLSPFDEIDELAFFMEQLHASAQREPEAYNHLMGALPDEMRQRLGQFEGEVHKRIVKKAEAAASSAPN